MTVTDPQAEHLSFGPQKSYDLAKNKDTYWTSVNSDSYVMDALAIFIQQTFSLIFPPVPLKEIKKRRPDWGDLTTTYQDNNDNTTIQLLDVTPPNWTIPAPDGKDSDLSKWEKFEPGTPTPKKPGLSCADEKNNRNWTSLRALMTDIDAFCADVGKAEALDGNPTDLRSQSLVRQYNDTLLSFNRPLGSDFKTKLDECSQHFGKIKDSCGVNDPQSNPKTYGGINQIDNAQYNITVTATRYVPGVCSIHVKEKDTYKKWVKGSLLDRDSFHLQVKAMDAEKKKLYDTGEHFQPAGKDGKEAFVIDKYYSPLSILPEKKGGNYVQYAIGDQHWTSKDNDPKHVPTCKVGGWDDHSIPGNKVRDMGCQFYC